MAHTIRDVLSQKGNKVLTVDPDAWVYDAVELMEASSVGSLVVARRGKMVGILTATDYAKRVILAGKSARETMVGEAMTSEVLSVGRADSVEDCLALMTDQRIRHLPVLEDGQLVGIVSGGDLVRAMLDEERFLTEQLVRYISGY